MYWDIDGLERCFGVVFFMNQTYNLGQIVLENPKNLKHEILIIIPAE